MDAGNMSIEELYTQENVGTDKFENDTKEEYIPYTSKQLKIKKKQDDEAMTSVCNFF